VTSPGRPLKQRGGPQRGMHDENTSIIFGYLYNHGV
jgi:hypothetical protein